MERFAHRDASVSVTTSWLCRSHASLSLALRAVIAVVLFATPAQAQRVWSPDAAATFASRRAPNVVGAQVAVATAEANRAFATVPRIGNPVVGLRLMVGVPDVPAATIGVLAGVPIDVSDRPGAVHRETRWAVREAQLALDVAVLDARYRALDAWAKLSLAQERVVVAEELYANARVFRERVASRAREQAATALDVALADRDLATSESELSDARRQRAEAETEFREALGLPATEAVRATTASSPLLPGIDREQLAQRAIERRAEPRQLEAASRRARASGERAAAQAVDPIFVAGEFEWQGYAQSSFGVSINTALPLVRRAQGERAVAAAESAAYATRSSLARNVVAREAVGAYDALRERLATLSALTERAIPAAQRVLAATETLFESGAADTFRVLTARRELAALRLRWVEARLEAWRARIQLERSLGEL